MTKPFINNSEITITEQNNTKTLTIPQKKPSPLKYVVVVFLCLWLCMWFFGVVTAGSQIINGDGGLFLIVWLCGWTVARAFAGYFLYRCLKKAIPETLTITTSSLSLDTGIAHFPPPINMVNLTAQLEIMKSLFLKRKLVSFTIEEIATLVLRESAADNRLTIDKGTERISLAVGASEIERENIYQFLKTFYDLG